MASSSSTSFPAPSHIHATRIVSCFPNNNSLVPISNFSVPCSTLKLRRHRRRRRLNLKSDPRLFRSQLDAHNPESVAHSPPIHSRIWKWRGYSIRYQCCGQTGPALLLIHGFGANSDHWRKNLPVLGNSHRVYSIDLIGYGYSDKPNPRHFKDSSFYTFQTWASQIIDFCLEVVKAEAFFICNSIGGLVGLEAAVMAPQMCKGLVILNISLRMLHIKKQPSLAKPLIKSFQSLLRCDWWQEYCAR